MHSAALKYIIIVYISNLTKWCLTRTRATHVNKSLSSVTRMSDSQKLVYSAAVPSKWPQHFPVSEPLSRDTDKKPAPYR